MDKHPYYWLVVHMKVPNTPAEETKWAKEFQNAFKRIGVVCPLGLSFVGSLGLTEERDPVKTILKFILLTTESPFVAEKIEKAHLIRISDTWSLKDAVNFIQG